MAVTLTATVGGSTSNTYATAAEATAYFNEHPNNSDWTGLADDDTRARYLIMAARDIDSLPIDGVKYDTDLTSGVPDQARRFPRAQDSDDGTTYIPDGVKDAQCEQAIYRALSSGPYSTRQMLQQQGVREAEFDDVRERYGDNNKFTTNQVCQTAYAILNSRGLIKHGGYA